jgi:protocatechuate 3,4-dioxygenase beta subunit
MRGLAFVVMLAVVVSSGAYATGVAESTDGVESASAMESASEMKSASAVESTDSDTVERATAAPSALQNQSNGSSDAGANATNQSTVSHVNPAEIDRERDLQGVQSWLAREISAQISESSDQLQDGQYESAKRLLGDDYDERYSQFREIAERVQNEPGGSSTESLDNLQQRARRFFAAVEQYERNYERFQRLEGNASERRLRKVARRLQRDEWEVRERSQRLLATYRNVSASTDMNLTESRRTAENVTENVTARQNEIEDELFVPTELTVRSAEESASFADPMVIRGRLRLANGTAIANQNATFWVGNRTVYARTNDTGAFTLRYRPTTISANVSSVTAFYIPDNRSIHQTSNVTLPVEIERTVPELDARAVTDTVRMDERVTVRGRVHADGNGVPNVPVVLWAGDERLANATTRSNGSFAVSGPLPETVPPDSVTRVALATEDKTIAPTNTTVNVTVRRSEASVSVSGSRTDNGTIRVVGRLTTENGTPVANQSIQLRVSGRNVATVETDRTGVYRASVVVPKSVRDRDAVAVAAAFDGQATNLRQASATDEVALLADAERTSIVERLVGSVTGAPWWAFLVFGSALVPIGYVLATRFGRDRRSEPASTTSRNRSMATETEVPDESADADLLRVARERLADGDPEAATHAAYVAVRSDLSNRFDAEGPTTHWEFFARCRSAGLDGDGLDALRQLVRADERAQFASESLSADAAERAVEVGRRLVGGDPDEPARADGSGEADE